MCSIYIRFTFNIDQFGCIFEEKRRISIIIPGKRIMKQVSYRSIKIVNVLFLRKTNVNVIPISFYIILQIFLRCLVDACEWQVRSCCV